MHFRTFRLQPPHAPPFRPCALLRSGFAPDSLWRLSAVVRTSLIPSSLISRIRPYRVCVAALVLGRRSTDYPLTSSCSPRGIAGSQLLSVTRWVAPPVRDFHPLYTLTLKRTGRATPLPVNLGTELQPPRPGGAGRPVCLAGAGPIGVKGPRRGADDNRSRTVRGEPQGTS